MHKAKKLFSIVLVAGWWIVLLWQIPSWAGDPATRGTRTAVDRTGASISLPPTIDKIIVTCYGGATHEIALMGGADRIIAQPTVKQFPQLLKIYPRFGVLPDIGSFDAINLEEIVGLKPDLVFAGISANQGNRKIKQLGIPVVVLGTGRTDIQGLLNEFAMVGKILETERLSDDLIRYWQATLSLIQEKVASIPAEARKKVFYTSSIPPFRTEGGLWWGHHWITAAGGLNVAQQIRFGQSITAEQVTLWNPDVIIVSGKLGQHFSANDLIGHPMLARVKAVQNKAVYSRPVGAFWWDRPSPEAILGILWLAKTLYPVNLADVDLKRETTLFFNRFYHYPLTDQEYGDFFR